MPVHSFQRPAGTVVEIEIDSAALKDNFLGDPATRTVAVYLPPGYTESTENYPLFVDLAGFTGSGLKRLAWTAFGESVPQRVDRLVREGKMGQVIVAFPDCFTSLGGNQYIDSTVVGAWETFLCQELVPRLEAEFRVRPGRDHRALYGKSSGGYGAMVHGMRHADVWGAVASHSGDMGFDWVYRRDFPACLDGLARHGRDIPRFLEHLRTTPKISGGDFHALMSLAMAATYDPQPDAPGGIRLPVDLETCELDERAWARWLQHDPVSMIEHTSSQGNLRALRGVFFDCGSRDQYAMHYGNRAFARKLGALNIEHTYEEFDDNHSSVDYRLDRSLPFLFRAVG
jgi:S-formylglutathione hydrolase FrmB